MENLIVSHMLNNIDAISGALTFPALIYIVFNQFKQNKSIRITSKGVQASLKCNLKDVHDKAIRERSKGKPVSYCFQDTFYTAYQKFIAFGEKDPQVDLWKTNMDHWCAK